MSTATKEDSFRKVLLERKQSVETELEHLDEEMRQYGVDSQDEHGGVGNHIADDGSNVQAQERILRVGGDLRTLRDQIDEAMGRLEDGTFGICQRCGKPIGAERLEYVPYVAYCIECQTIVDRENGGR